MPIKEAALTNMRDKNDLLASLPRKDHKLLKPFLEQVTLTFGEAIYHHGELIQYVYFPTDSLVSLLTVIDDHQALEVGMVGHEGMLGVPLALGAQKSPVHAVVQGSGIALRMTAEDFLTSLQLSPSLHRAIYRYVYELMIQMTQTAACNRFHRVEARLARWLLMTRDRVRSNQFHLTQELLGHMLGVRREGVTEAAGELKMRKLLSYVRGEISILDEVGLEAAACPCYQIVKEHCV